MWPCQQGEKSMLGQSKPHSWLDPKGHGSLEITINKELPKPSTPKSPLNRTRVRAPAQVQKTAGLGQARLHTGWTMPNQGWPLCFQKTAASRSCRSVRAQQGSLENPRVAGLKVHSKLHVADALVCHVEELFDGAFKSSDSLLKLGNMLLLLCPLA